MLKNLLIQMSAFFVLAKIIYFHILAKTDFIFQNENGFREMD